jgi:phospho-2-dehydro-3-deoxyheptonate aldolase
MPLLPSYNQLKQNFLLPPYLKAKVLENRQTISAILSGKDPRKLLIVGPCSIHEAKSAMEFGRGLNDLSKEIESQFFTIMRVYCERAHLNWLERVPLRSLFGWLQPIGNRGTKNSRTDAGIGSTEYS